MAEIDLTLKTTQVVIVSAFVLLTIYFNFVLVRSSLDVIFWATITSIPLIGLKNSTTFISPYLTDLKKVKKHNVLLFGLIIAKSVLYDKNKKAIVLCALAIFYVIIEKSLRRSNISNTIKLFIIASLIAIVFAATLNSIVDELKFVATTFNIKGLANEKNLKYMNDLVTPNLDKLVKQFKQNNSQLILKFQKCGMVYEKIKIGSIKDINFSELYQIGSCLFNEYKKQIVDVAKKSQPVIIKAAKRILVFGEHSMAAFSLFVTFVSTVYIMTKQSIQPMDVIDAFLNLVDNSGYLSSEFKEILDGLIMYYLQKILVTGISTFLTFSLFSMNVIAIPTIFSILSVLIPGAPTYLIPFVGVSELLFLQKPYWYMIIFVIACNRIKIYCDKIITLKVSLINSKVILFVHNIISYFRIVWKCKHFNGNVSIRSKRCVYWAHLSVNTCRFLQVDVASSRLCRG